MKFRSHFDYDVEVASNEATLEGNGIESGESLTVQSMSEDADINVMMKRFGVTGHLPENPRVPTYGDFSGVSDYRSALHSVMAAQDAFSEFPAEVRAKFDNDPQRLLEFVSLDANYAEAVKLGLMKEGAKAPAPLGVAPVSVGLPPSSGSPGGSSPVQSGQGS